jgi:hypothetical protein
MHRLHDRVAKSFRCSFRSRCGAPWSPRESLGKQLLDFLNYIGSILAIAATRFYVDADQNPAVSRAFLMIALA